MRWTSPRGVALRAVLAAALNLGLTLVIAGVFAGALGTLGLVVLGRDPAAVLDPSGSVDPLVVLLAGVAGVGCSLWLLRRRVRDARSTLLEDTIPAAETSLTDDPSIESAVTRLAARLDVREPELRVHTTRRPLAYSTYRPEHPTLLLSGDERPVVVVSSWLLSGLEADELEAVLAHELAHLANDDLRLVSWLLAPVFAAEHRGYHPENPDLVWKGLADLGTVGAGVFTRGRELAADRNAARVTGDPATLASALEQLYAEDAGPPEEDLRQHARTTNALNVHPAFVPAEDGTPFASHPPLSARLAALRSLESG